ncbi:MAG: CotH kinase family protein [Bacteroidota bacterium]
MKQLCFYPLLFSCLLLLTFSACNEDKDEDFPTPEEETNTDLDLEQLGQSDLALFSIDTEGKAIPNEPKVAANYTIKENGNISYAGRLGIELRGSTSRRLFEKKSFGVETWDQNNEDMDVGLLGFPEEEDWVLQGPYADKTLMRNVLIYELSNQIGMYAARTQFVELAINDNYLGVYAFMEKLKRDNDRIDIKRLDENDTEEDRITGGYILKIDKTSGDNDIDDWAGDAIYTASNSFRSDYAANGQRLNTTPFGAKQGNETYFMYEYPDRDDITVAQKEYIQNYISDFEEALIGASFDANSTAPEYLNYIDLESFAQFFILNELSANPDAYRISTFLHKDRGEKLKMGPIWDFNLALGLDGRSSTNQWIYRYNERFPDDLWLVHFWWTKLLEDPIFRAEVQRQWNLYRSDILSMDNINSIIADQESFLESNDAINRNFKKWEVLGVALPFNSFVGKDYAAEREYLKDWIQQRLNWLDGEIGSW